MSPTRSIPTRRLFAGLLATIVGFVPASASADRYQYDAAGRLTQVHYSSGGITAFTHDANGNILSITSSLAVSGVGEETAAGRFEFALSQNAPNPGSGPMVVRFSIPSRGRVVMRVFDVSGRLVSTPVHAVLEPGHYSARLLKSPAAGVYFYRLDWGGKSLSRRLVVLP